MEARRLWRASIVSVCQKTFRYGSKRLGSGGEARGGRARLEWDQMPRNALHSKVCGERSEDFCAALRHKSNGIFEGPGFGREAGAFAFVKRVAVSYL